MGLQRSSRRKKGISGLFVALILFAMLFSVEADYYLFVNQTTFATNSASVVRQDAVQQARQENLAINVGISVSNALILSAINTGGVPTSISSIYLVDSSTGKMITPPGVMGQAATNLSASQWPLVLDIGAATNAISGCVVGKIGCSISLANSGYTYVSGTVVFVNVVTGRGDTFAARFPPLSNSGVGGSTLVVTMVAAPTPPLTQVFSCTGCVTLTVTAYNFASSSVFGVSLSPAIPVASATGTASLSGGACSSPSPSSTILAYSGSGNAPSATFTCTYNTQTGKVGGFASFSGYVQGTLNGQLISSAQAVSNNIQIGGNPNVPTQGAFSSNFFFLRYSSCQNAPSGSIGSYTYSSFCTTIPTTMPPSNVGNLPDAATVSAGSNYYVAFYVQITNNYPATLDILQYTFLQLDASHPPPDVGNETDFWLAGPASTYNSAACTNSQNCYFPNYCASGGCASNKLPTLTAYAGNEVTCGAGDPSHNCIDVAYGQTVTLTLAACGYGASNWDWGGTKYASNFDSSTGCASSAPGFSNLGSANVISLVICFLYQGLMYTQVIQYQGLAVIP